MKVYIYQHKQLLMVADTIKDAARETHVSPFTVRRYIDTAQVTKRGYFYSLKEVSESKLNRLPDREEKLKSKKGLDYAMDGKCRKVVGSQEYEVDAKNGLVTYIPVTKAEKKEMLTRFIAKVAKERWRTLPRNVAILEKQFAEELINNIFM